MQEKLNSYCAGNQFHDDYMCCVNYNNVFTCMIIIKKQQIK